MGNMTKIPTVMVFKQNGDNALSLSWKCDFFSETTCLSQIVLAIFLFQQMTIIIGTSKPLFIFSIHAFVSCDNR